MADRLPSAERCKLMSKVRNKNTDLELTVRRILHRNGYRFRLHTRDLPGSPDIVLPRYRMALFVHGCFWHGHDCRLGSKPKSNQNYWGPKIATNRSRDERNLEKLKDIGWSVLVLWECDIRRAEGLRETLENFMA